MRLIRGAVCAAVIAALAAPERPISAQTRGLQDQPISRDLVEALLAGPSGRVTPSIVVGELPPAILGKLYVPAGARILGGTSSGLSSVAILMSAEKPDALAEEFRREMPALGWTWFDQPNATTYATMGFKDAPGGAPPAASRTQTYCGAGATLTVRIDPQGVLESRIFASVAGGNFGAMMQQQAVRVSGPTDPLRNGRTPVLINPPGAHNQIGVCPPNNMTGPGGRTELATQMTPDELFAHYGRQLADSGWKPGGGATVSRTWTKIDSTGTAFELELMIKTFALIPTCRRLSTSIIGR